MVISAREMPFDLAVRQPQLLSDLPARPLIPQAQQEHGAYHR
jgi:hypothetical protein